MIFNKEYWRGARQKRHPLKTITQQSNNELPLQWRHNERGVVSNHRHLDGLLNPLFRRGSKKTSKLRVAGLCAGNSPVNSPNKGPVTRKMFLFDDVIMGNTNGIARNSPFVWTLLYLIRISHHFPIKWPIGNMSSFVLGMSWRYISDTPSFESIMTLFTDA